MFMNNFKNIFKTRYEGSEAGAVKHVPDPSFSNVAD